MKIYKVSRWINAVQNEEVERVTDKTIWYRTRSGRLRRAARDTYYDKYFDTFEEAAAFLRKRLIAELAQAEKTVVMCEEALMKLVMDGVGSQVTT